MCKLLLLDGNSLINRAFYALPLLTTKDGDYTNAVLGFLNIFFRFMDEERPDHVAVAFDLPIPTLRHEKFTAYKGKRRKAPDELKAQFPVLKRLLQLMTVQIYELAGYEADDILGTAAKAAEQQGFDVVVVSGDRDLLQIASDKIKIRIPKTKAGKTEVEDYDAAKVVALFGVTPTAYIDVKALMGDVSDNIPGVPGIGEKTAFKIIQTYQSIEAAKENADAILPKKAAENLVAYWDQAVLSKELATILLDVPLAFDASETKISPDAIYNEAARLEIRRLEFKSLFTRFAGEESVAAVTGAAPLPFDRVEDAAACAQVIEKISAAPFAAYRLIYDGRRPVGLCLSAPNGVAAFIGGFSGDFRLLEQCRAFFESGIKKIALDLKRDIVALHPFGIEIRTVVFDETLAGYILDSSRDSYAYDDIAQAFLGETYLSEADFFGKGKKRKPAEAFSTAVLAQYYIRQTDVMVRAYPAMDRLLTERGQTKLYYEIELPLAFVLADMELYGIKVDRAALIDYGHTLDGQIERLTAQIYALSGEPFNIASPKQLGVILFEKLGLSGGKKTKTGYSTAADVLEKLVGENEIVALILEYRTYTKLKSTYADGLLAAIDSQTGKIYTTFHQTVTTTGRISSTEPNLQNIPIRLPLGKELRKIFIPSDDSFVFADADYSQIELRVLAAMSGDDTFIGAFQEGQDIHRLTASQVFHTPYDRVTEHQRSSAKAVNFGIVYGIGAYSLSQDIHTTVREAERYIAGYYEKYPEMRTYFDKTIETARKDGYAVTLFGRRRLIPELNSGNFNERAFGERVAMNMPVQGSAADIIKIAMLNVWRRLKAEGLSSRLILQVHDELLIEMKKDETARVTALLKEEMENAAKLCVPLLADVKVGSNWYEAH